MVTFHFKMEKNIIMTQEEKKKKAVLVAVAHFLEQEKSTILCSDANKKFWAKTGKAMIMNKIAIVQRRGRLLKGA